MKKKFTIILIVLSSLATTGCTDDWLRYIIFALTFGVEGSDELFIYGVLFSQKPPAMPPPPAGTNGSEPPPAGTTSDGELREGPSLRDVLSNPHFSIGPSMSWLGGDKEDNEKFPAKPGFQLGAQWQIPVGDKVYAEPGLSYANRGVGYEYEESGTYEPGTPGGSYNYSYGQRKRLHYLEVPVMVSGNVAPGLDLFGGPQVAFLLGAKVVNESNGETTSTDKSKEGLRNVDFGLNAGVRYHVPNTFFSVTAGYYHGLSNLVADQEYGGSYGSDQKYMTRAARVGIAYDFPAAKRNARTVGKGKSSLQNWVKK